MYRYQHLLAPIDFSNSSINVVQRARELAEMYDARLTLLHVLEDVPLGIEPFGESTSLMLNEELRNQQRENAEKQMQSLIQQLNLPLSVEPAIKEGFATDTILEFAQHKNIDLIVIAHSGKKGFLGFLGSTANAVVKATQCDVLVMRDHVA
ncbi:universal stress protein A [Thiothrix caldifontis]|jgi:Universal stress protein UspA and related nucleotide-binding proteins|uniref:Universal stress protein n=1 Tax=Thiothrix caldifontis TaxID=525918 RepID=A0A1H4D4Z2_9GAMM|nr:universal stress protein [Thiothrix caldifontis]SEA67825.1 universal stress protein A [Thiothrix caldifontis]